MSVSVGVSVGGSGVNVAVAVGVISKTGDKVPVGTFSVSAAITVCAMTVLRASVSGVAAMVGAAHAILAINNTATEKQIR